MNPATKSPGHGATVVIRRLLSAIPTRSVAEGFACDAVLFWIVAYCQTGIEPSWLIPIMQGMIAFDMLLTLTRAYKRQPNASYVSATDSSATDPFQSGEPPRR